jgi:hypothetical protein
LNELALQESKLFFRFLFRLQIARETSPQTPELMVGLCRLLVVRAQGKRPAKPV